MSHAEQHLSATTDDARLEGLGYTPQLNRVLGLFSNFSVGFTYLSPMVGIYSLFVYGLGAGGPAYIWLNFIPIAGMLLVALVFGELASHYPVAGAIYQYSKFSVGPSYGWFVGWFYGLALFITVAAVDTGVVAYFSELCNNWLNTSLDPTDHLTILLITIALLAIQTALNITGAQVMARVAQFGVFVEIIGTFGIALILAIHGFNHGLGFLFKTDGAENASTNAYGLDFGGNWLFGAAIVAVLAPVYIYYGFESCGDIAEETKDASRQIPRAMRLAVIWGGVGSIVLTGALLLAMPGGANPTAQTVTGDEANGNGVPFILSSLPSGVQDLLLLVIVFAFFSCGTSIQGAGSRLAFSYARDDALPGSTWLRTVHSHFRTPINALIGGAVVSALFVLLVFYQPDHNVDIGFITYPANVTALTTLVSFGVSGIYLSFFLTVIGVIVARMRGWIPEGAFQLRQWAWPVTIAAALYLGLMLLNVVAPTGLDSGRGALFNLDWITLLVMFIIAVVGAVFFAIARPDRGVSAHIHDEQEATGAERHD
jgi:amino acid transporter